MKTSPSTAFLQDQFLLQHEIDTLSSLRERAGLRIDELTAELKRLSNGAGVESTQPVPTKQVKKRRLTAVARARIAAAQKNRWAEYHRQRQVNARADQATAAGKATKKTRRAAKRAVSQNTGLSLRQNPVSLAEMTE